MHRTIIGVFHGDTRSFDYSSHEKAHHITQSGLLLKSLICLTRLGI